MSYYKYAERDADAQINWAEVGKGLSDMLAETNRVREEKKDALDKAQREAINYVAETPNGEHVGARTSILEYSDQVSNRLRIADQLLKSGQMSVKDYTIFRQNIVDDTNLAFNANKVYQEKYSDVMQGVRDKKYSQLYADNFAEVEGFGNWGNIGWEIAPNGTVMAGKMTEQEIDGKKVRTLDKTPGSLRSMNYLNQALVGQIDFYNYDEKINSFVDKLGTEKKTIVTLGKLQKQGLIKTVDDITSRKDIDPETQKVLSSFIEAENDQIATITGNPIDAARVLVDSAIFAPNKKQYSITTSEQEAKSNPEKILKVVDPETGGFRYVINEKQQEDANDFVRNQMRAKYDYEESAQVVGQLQEPPQYVADKNQREKDAQNFGVQLGTAIKSNNKEEVANSIKYLAQKSERQVIREGDKIRVLNIDGTGESVFDLNSDPDEIVAAMVSSFGTKLPEDVILKYAKSTLKGSPANTTVTATGIVETSIKGKPIEIPENIFTIKSVKATANLRNLLPEGFTVEDAGGTFGNDVHIYAPGKSKANGDDPYIFNANLNASEIPAAKDALNKFINSGDKQVQSGKRTIAQIMQQDGVDFAEATKRFNAQ
jgi:hypothetical protein